MEYTLTFLGPPIPKARPRFSRCHGPYDRQREDKKKWLTQLYSQRNNWEFLEGPIALRCLFYMPIPASYSKKNQERLIGLPHSKRPDVDNLIKWPLDIFNGIVYHDDGCIYKIEAQKIYGEEPKTVITITTCSKQQKDDFEQDNP